MRIQVKTAEDTPPDAINQWQKIANNFYRFDCEQDRKMSVLRSLMQNPQVLDVSTYAPSLDEIYAHYLEREDV
ncbi:ABC transporter ATP-binding protein [Oligella ureolytica]